MQEFTLGHHRRRRRSRARRRAGVLRGHRQLGKTGELDLAVGASVPRRRRPPGRRRRPRHVRTRRAAWRRPAPGCSTRRRPASRATPRTRRTSATRSGPGSFGRSTGARPRDRRAGGAASATDPAGSVTVLYGSPTGLRTQNAQRFTQATPGMAGDREHGRPLRGVARLGERRAVRASATWWSAWSSTRSAARRTPARSRCMYGSANGLVVAGNQLFNQDSPGSPASRPRSNRWAPR